MLKKFITGFITGSLVLGAVIPSLASTVVVSGNGVKSHVNVDLDFNNHTSVHQSSTTEAWVGVWQGANSGGNKVKDNTGSGSVVTSGDALNQAKVKVKGGTNLAGVPLCGCVNDQTEVSVTGNGAHSHTDVDVDNSTSVKVSQSTETTALVHVSQESNSGDNSVKDNTGGQSSVNTGDAGDSVSVSVSGGSNLVNPEVL